MTQLANIQEPDSSLTNVLFVGHRLLSIYGGSTDLVNPQWYCPISVSSVKEVPAALKYKEIDVIICPLTQGRDEGLALPSLLLDLKKRELINRVPGILWCSDLEPRVLEFHAKMARESGVTAEVVGLQCQHFMESAIKRIKEGLSSEPAANTSAPNVDEIDLLRSLLDESDFRIVLQPQVQLATGYIVGAEALSRWRHPTMGDIAPSIFISLASRAGLNVLLFHFIAVRVVAVLRQLMERDVALPIAVSASVDTLCTEGLAEKLERRLMPAGVPNSLLKIELTEDVVAEDMLLLSTTLSTLRLRGFRVSVDDFGRGASTLDLVTRMPFSELKVDGAFVRGMGKEPGCSAAVSAAISVGNEMNIEVIAEGVETRAQVQELLNAGCCVGQGYGFSPPLEVEDFVELVCSDRMAELPQC